MSEETRVYMRFRPEGEDGPFAVSITKEEFHLNEAMRMATDARSHCLKANLPDEALRAAESLVRVLGALSKLAHR